MHPERLVLVLPIEPLTTGESFAVSRWPLHITVIPPFTARVPVDEIVRLTQLVAAEHTSFEVAVGAEATFGRDHDVAVNLVLPTSALTRLRDDLATRLVEAGPRPARHDFAPHITMKEHARAHQGEVYTIESVAVVDMAPRASPAGRRVIAAVPLGG